MHRTGVPPKHDLKGWRHPSPPPVPPASPLPEEGMLSTQSFYGGDQWLAELENKGTKSSPGGESPQYNPARL